MELWTYWLGAIQSLLNFLSSQVGLGTGLGIVAAVQTGVLHHVVARRIRSGAVSI